MRLFGFNSKPEEKKKKNRHVGKQLFYGWDPAQKNDRSALLVLERGEDGVLESRMMINLRGIGYTEQVKEIIAIGKTRGLTRIAIDGTNNSHVVETLAAAFPGRVLNVYFTRAMKEQLINDLRIAFQDKLIRLGRNFKHFRLLCKELNELDPKKLDHPPKGSSDFAWSLALAVHASKFNFMPLRRGWLPHMER